MVCKTNTLQDVVIVSQRKTGAVVGGFAGSSQAGAYHYNK